MTIGPHGFKEYESPSIEEIKVEVSDLLMESPTTDPEYDDENDHWTPRL